MDLTTFTPELSIMGVVGFLATLVAALINRPTWSSEKRRWVTIGVSLLLALVALGAVGALDGIQIVSVQQVLTILLGVVGVAQAAYTALQKPIHKLEIASTPATSSTAADTHLSASTSEERYAAATEHDATPKGPDYVGRHLPTEDGKL